MSEVRNPRKALLRDLAYLKVLKAISAKRPADATRIFHQFRLADTKSLRREFFKRVKEMPKAKTTGFCRRRKAEWRPPICNCSFLAANGPKLFEPVAQAESFGNSDCGELQGD